MKPNLIDQYPILSKIYNKVTNSNRLKNVLSMYDPIADFSKIKCDECGDFSLDIFNDFDESVFSEVDENIIKIRNNTLCLDSIENDVLEDLIEKTLLYINIIIKFVELSCRFTNKSAKIDLVNLISRKLKESIPGPLRKMIKISSDKKLLERARKLVKLANYYDMIGDFEKASDIDIALLKIAEEDEEEDEFGGFDPTSDIIQEEEGGYQYAPNTNLEEFSAKSG